MSRRVTVVLSQGHRLGVERQHREDELVAGLLMSSEVEATVIADLARMEPAGTDQLCLESVSGTAVILAWYDAGQAYEELRRIGVAARFLNKMANDAAATASATPPHEFYYYDLNDGKPLEYFLDVVARVAEEVEKAPVALTNFNGSELPLASAPSADAARATPAPSTSSAPVADEDESEERDDLDDLMDALDRVEL